MIKVNFTEDSPTVIINTIARQKMAAGIPIVNLSVGEPELPPHPTLIGAVSKTLAEGKIFYPPIGGFPELKQAATEWMNSVYDCKLSTENCFVTVGGKFGIYLLTQFLIEPDDEVIIIAPYWVSYPGITKIFHGKPVIINTKEINNWKLQPNDLRNACTQKTKILMLNNACNPTGSLYSKAELELLLRIAKEKNILVISDEVYSGLVYGEQPYISCANFSEHTDHVFVIQSCSKNFAMTGWRIGFVFGPTEIIKGLTSLASQSTSGVAVLSQSAALAAFQHAGEIMPWVNSEMLRRRNILVNAFKKYLNLVIYPPDSALYIFISLKDLGTSYDDCVKFCKDALNYYNVALVPGKAFGQPGFIRFSFGGSKIDLESGIKNLANFIYNFKS